MTMRKLMAVAVVMVAVLNACGAESIVVNDWWDEVDGVTWTYQVNDGKAEIWMASPASGDIIIPSTLGGYPVTSIGSSAFRYCHSLTSVTIPEGMPSLAHLVSVSAWAFHGLILNGTRRCL